MRFLQACALVPSILSLRVVAAIPDAFDWDTITPNPKLQYHQCYGQHQCARLLVPLDWLDSDNENTVALAIVKLPAKVPETDPSFGGTIFINPGGPGGSGVIFLLSAGPRLQNLADGNKHYEILSWDPRGLGFTTPIADCFEDIRAQDFFELQEVNIGPLGASKDSLRRHWAHAQAYGQLCEQGAVNSSILPYLTTPSVVRDMVAMLDQIDDLRSEDAKHLPMSYDDDDNAEKRLQMRSTTPLRMLYWGFSYGSLLGNAFASMYPGRVGRIIIDGIVDANDYAEGKWLTNLQDTEKVVEYFYQTCFEAGDQCALKKESDSKWENLKERVDDLKAQLDIKPAAVLNGKEIVIITGTELLAAFVGPIYSPLTAFARLGQLLHDALQGNYTLLLQDLTQDQPTIHDTCTHKNGSSEMTLLSKVALQAIKCADGEDDTELSIDQLEEYTNELKRQSPTLGSFWTAIRFGCSGWRIRPKYRFTGPFTTPPHDPSGTDNSRPAAPLLFFSSLYDPVTPLRNAVAMAEAHPGASWVVQESVGHCAEGVPSRCSRKIIQEYFEHGTVPESGTRCSADCDPWHSCEETPTTLRAADFNLWF